MYIIKTTGRKRTLFLVDRNKTKRFWWTYNLDLVMKFKSIEKANKIAKNYKYNNPTVITLERGYNIRRKVEDAYYEKQKLEKNLEIWDEDELGWDAHKGTF